MDSGSFVFDPGSQPLAWDGIPPSRPLTKQDLEAMQRGIRAFEAALAAGEEPRPSATASTAARAVEQHDNRSLAQSASGTETSRLGSTDDRSGGYGSPARSEAEPAGGENAGRSGSQKYHCLIVAGYLGAGYGGKNGKSTEQAIIDVCERHVGAASNSLQGGYPYTPDLDRIHVILQSGGGSLDSAYKIVLFLRRFAKDIRVYVPARAKSAATLIAVGGDRIVMSPYAELGPLDTQITDPRNPSTHVSALDCYRSVDYVREFGLQAISRALKVMLSETEALVPLSSLIDSATTFAIGSASPMLAQVKALDFGAWGRTLKIGENYARNVRLRLQHPDTDADAARIAWQLVYGYTHHPFAIDSEEAKNLGLRVAIMPRDVYKAASTIVNACHDNARFIGFSEDVGAALKDVEETSDGESGSKVDDRSKRGMETTAHANIFNEPERIFNEPEGQEQNGTDFRGLSGGESP